MHKQIYEVPAEFAAQARFRKDDYEQAYAESVRDPEGFWAPHGPADRLGRAVHQGQGRQLRREGLPHPLVPGRQAERLLQLPRPAPRDARRQDRAASTRATTRTSPATITYRELYHRVCKLANALKSLGVQKGDRVTIYLPMIPEAAVAMLACARIGAIHSVVFGGFSPDSLAGPHRGLRVDRRDHVGRRHPRRQEGAAQGERRPGAVVAGHRDRQARAGRQAHRRERPDVRPRPLVRRGRRRPAGRMRARAGGRRGPAVHPLHVRFDRQAEGRAAHERRLPRLRGVHARSRVRPPRRRRLLVHRGRRLGHRPQLRRLRTARERRDVADVRRRAELSGPGPLLAGLRQAQGHDLLHRAHGAARADARGRGAGQEALARSRCGCSAPSASRSTRRRGSGITASSATVAARSSTRGGRRRPAAS